MNDVLANLTPMRAAELSARLFRHVRVRRAGASQCWRWTGGLGGRRQMPRLQLDATHGTCARRLMWRLYCGPIPPGNLVWRTCDDPRCVKPDHLTLMPRGVTRRRPQREAVAA